MEELIIDQQSGVIKTNLDTIEKGLRDYLKDYEGYTVSEDTIVADKKVLAELRKTQKNLDDARKAVKKEWEKPYKEFEERCKKVIALVDEPINLIKEQLDLFEEQRTNEKLGHIKEIYAGIVGEYSEYLPFDAIFDSKWLNVSTKDKDISYDISEKKTHVMSDINIIKGLHSEIEDKLLEVYRNSGNNLASAIERNTDYLDDKEKVVAQVKTEEHSEVKPSAENMGELNNIVQAFKTVHIIVSAEDLQAAKNALDFSEIKYQILEK